jgi:L-tartrate/succinate antiporter
MAMGSTRAVEQPLLQTAPRRTRSALSWKAGIPLAVGLLLVLVPAPHGLDPAGWRYFALFAAVIAALMLEPLPAAAVGFLGVTVGAVLQLPFTTTQASARAFNGPAEAIKWALSGFTNATVWLIFAAFMFALGYEKTRLGKRIALQLVRRLGRRTIGLGYAVTLSDLLLAPFTPSNTARSGGILFPIVRSIPPLYGSSPGETSRRMGSYLLWTTFAATCVTSSMFVTALAPNLLALELVKKTVGVDVTWSRWAVGFLPVGAILVLSLPLLVYVIHPPEVKESREATAWATEELRRMGRVTAREVGMGLLVLLALGLWIFGRSLLDATTVALVVIAIMVVGRIVTWDDILANKSAWNVLVWFATLVALADGLNRVGFVGWFAKVASALLAGLSPVVVMTALVALFFLVHYMFASLTAHTTAVLPVVLAAGAAVPGIPVAKFALLLCYALGLMGIITPYATGPAPVYFGSGYVSRKDFWMLGLVFGLIFLAALLVIGVPYLLALSF